MKNRPKRQSDKLQKSRILKAVLFSISIILCIVLGYSTLSENNETEWGDTFVLRNWHFYYKEPLSEFQARKIAEKLTERPSEHSYHIQLVEKAPSIIGVNVIINQQFQDNKKWIDWLGILGGYLEQHDSESRLYSVAMTNRHFEPQKQISNLWKVQDEQKIIFTPKENLNEARKVMIAINKRWPDSRFKINLFLYKKSDEIHIEFPMNADTEVTGNNLDIFKRFVNGLKKDTYPEADVKFHFVDQKHRIHKSFVGNETLPSH